MKTREIEVWVEKDFTGLGCIISKKDASELVRSCGLGSDRVELRGKPAVSAKLIIEIPERKAIITESEFDEMFSAGVIANKFAEAKAMYKEKFFNRF